ncbi:MAG: GNAT family N-acetyltransferase [Eudoraea sp.]|nr:GNAT family N-acetyltransferase [Eudoraea sp.]
MDKNRILIIPVNPEHFDTYIRVGSKSYNEHYLHLWQNQDPTPYMEVSFRKEVVRKEWEDSNCLLFLIYVDKSPAGILTLVLNKTPLATTVKDGLFLERIYLLREYSGQGLGTYALKYIEALGKEYGREQLYLATMQKGQALNFYKQNGFYILGEKQLTFPGMVESERPMYILGKKLK